MMLPIRKARQWLVASALGVVVIFTWGSTYYLSAILADAIASDTGWSIGSVAGALSIGLFIASLASPKIRRRIQNGSGRSIPVRGCILICIGLCMIGTAENIWVFWFGCIVLGFGMRQDFMTPPSEQVYGFTEKMQCVRSHLLH